jgi:hypothetical protein
MTLNYSAWEPTFFFYLANHVEVFVALAKSAGALADLAKLTEEPFDRRRCVEVRATLRSVVETCEDALKQIDAHAEFLSAHENATYKHFNLPKKED